MAATNPFDDYLANDGTGDQTIDPTTGLPKRKITTQPVGPKDVPPGTVPPPPVVPPPVPSPTGMPAGMDAALAAIYAGSGLTPADRGSGFADWQYWQDVGPSQYGRLKADIAGTGTDQPTGTPGAGAWQTSGSANRGGGGQPGPKQYTYQQALDYANQKATTAWGHALTDADIAAMKQSLGYQEGAPIDASVGPQIDQWIATHKPAPGGGVDKTIPPKTDPKTDPTSGADGTSKSSALYDLLMQRAKQGLDVNPNDPIIKGQTDAYRAEQTRSERTRESALAERAGADANISAETRQGQEAIGQDTAGFEASLMGKELGDRRTEIQNALNGAQGLITDEQRLALTGELEKLRLAEQKSEFGQNLAQNDKLAQQSFGLDYARLNQQQKQFVDAQVQQQDQFMKSLQQRAFEYDTTSQFNNSPLNG